jgi:hypothetical protein
MDTAIEEMMKNIQSSRPVGPKVLYGGDLQDNTDQYFRPSPFHNLDNVPKPPPNLFSEYGATAVVDKRPFMTAQPQVPRDPELEALNQYFNKERITAFAVSASRGMIGEVLAKQAEQVANAFVKDEIDRRAGIRKATLLSAGVPEADATRQIAQEALNGINLRTMDLRDRQIQDAVNLYYNINNLPTPATQPQTNAVPPTVPSGTEVPMEEADQVQEMNTAMEDTTEFPAEEPKPSEETEGIAQGGAGIPMRPGGSGSSTNPAEIPPFEWETASRRELIDFIRANNISTPETVNQRTGAILSPSTLSAINVETLREIVARFFMMGRRFPEF